VVRKLPHSLRYPQDFFVDVSPEESSVSGRESDGFLHALLFFNSLFDPNPIPSC